MKNQVETPTCPPDHSSHTVFTDGDFPNTILTATSSPSTYSYDNPTLSTPSYSYHTEWASSGWDCFDDGFSQTIAHAGAADANNGYALSHRDLPWSYPSMINDTSDLFADPSDYHENDSDQQGIVLTTADETGTQQNNAQTAAKERKELQEVLIDDGNCNPTNQPQRRLRTGSSESRTSKRSSTTARKAAIPHRRRTSIVSNTTSPSNSQSKKKNRDIDSPPRSLTSANSVSAPTRRKSSHNEVEKQYRSRLNNEFQQLSSKIPEELVIATGVKFERSTNSLSKADTLVLAEQYIKKLENEEKELTGANEQLTTDFEGLRAVWGSSGGGVSP